MTSDEDYIDMMDEASECHCEDLFDCFQKPAIFELAETKERFCFPVIILNHDYTERFGENKDVMTFDQEFLIQCSVLETIGKKEIPECSYIYCRNKLCIDVFEVIPDLGSRASRKHDKYGYCFRVLTNACDELELSEWTTLKNSISEVLNSQSQNVSSVGLGNNNGKVSSRRTR